MLAHFNNVTVANQNREPVYLNLFETTFEFPKVLPKLNAESAIMSMQATSINLELTPDLEVSKQYFKYSGRQFLNTKQENSLSKFTIKFNVNVTDKFAIDTWNMLKQWYDLGWNSQTGELHYKSEMIGTVVAHVHDRKGIVIRRVEYRNVMVTKLSGMSLEWSKGELYSCDAEFVADTWIDLYRNI